MKPADSLQVYDRRERTLVQIADLALAPLRWRPSSRTAAGPVRRVLLLRLERIGDLLMTLEALRHARTTWPEATIDLVVGGWNASLAALIPDVDHVRIASVPWLAREEPSDSWPALLSGARRWRREQYDVGLNFEPDIRSNFLLWQSGARVRLGYSSGGGGAFLTSAGPYDSASHVAANAVALVARAASVAGGTRGAISTNGPRLDIPSEAKLAILRVIGTARRPLIAIHPSGGRASKQWHLDRFAAVARQLSAAYGASIVLTGSARDAPLVAAMRAQLTGVDVIDSTGTADLVSLAALLQSVDLLISGDTGPMHLASAVDTPVVALFGPSNPARYGPRARHERVLFAGDVPCRPCGQVRLPPERCRGHVPDCMDGITVEAAVRAAGELLNQRHESRAAGLP
jgi:heptosyltransferase-1